MTLHAAGEIEQWFEDHRVGWRSVEEDEDYTFIAARGWDEKIAALTRETETQALVIVQMHDERKELKAILFSAQNTCQLALDQRDALTRDLAAAREALRRIGEWDMVSGSGEQVHDAPRIRAIIHAALASTEGV